MATFKLLAGQHQQADPDWEPSKQDQAEAERTGTRLRAPTRTYHTGETVESDTDLVAKFGSEKFAFIGGELRKGRQSMKGARRTNQGQPGSPSAEMLAKNPTSFPAGQVSTGFQGSTSLPDGRTVSGPIPGPEVADDEAESGETASSLEDRYGGDLEDHTVEELKEIAEAEEIELPARANKAEIVKALRGKK